MQTVGRIDRNIFRCVAEEIITDEVILTDDRGKHIVDRRGADFLEKYGPYFPLILADPDYIFPDNHIHSVLVCKTVGEGEDAVNLVLRLAVEGDDPAFKNSIITAIKESKKRFAQRLRNHVPIYKKG